MKSEDLNLEDWPLEDGFKIVSDFLDSMPCNSQSTEEQTSKRASSPSSVSSSDRSSLNRASIQIETTQDIKLKALEQHMDEVSVWLAQSEVRREKLLARVLAQLQTINSNLQRPVHIKTVTINDSEREPMTPPANYTAIDPTSLDTTTMGIDDKLPGYPTGDDVLQRWKTKYPQYQILALQQTVERAFSLTKLC